MEPVKLQQLCDKEDIRTLVVQYCRSCDRRDFATLATLYTPDATDDHGKLYCGSAAGYVTWLEGMLETMTATVHHVMNHFIEFDPLDSSRARGEVCVMAYHLRVDKDGQENQIITGGRYLDHYAKNDGVWRFTKRETVMDWNEVETSLRRWPITAGIREGDAGWRMFSTGGSVGRF